MSEPAQKRPRTDGSLDRVDTKIIEAASDPEKWIAERKKNWPTRQRVEERKQAQAEAQLRNPEPQVQEPSTTAAPKRVCRYFLQGRCRHGDNCKFSHEATPKPRSSGEKVYRRYEAAPQNSLFVKLVQTDLDKEDVQVLKFIEWLDQSGQLE